MLKQILTTHGEFGRSIKRIEEMVSIDLPKSTHYTHESFWEMLYGMAASSNPMVERRQRRLIEKWLETTKTRALMFLLPTMIK